MQKHPNVQIIMKLFTLVMLSLVPSVTVCSGFSKEVGIYSGTYGNDDVEVFLPEEVTYHLTGGDGVFYEVRNRLLLFVRLLWYWVSWDC